MNLLTIVCAVFALSACGGGGGEPTQEEKVASAATIEEICPRDGVGPSINVNGVDIVFTSVEQYRAHLDAGFGPCYVPHLDPSNSARSGA